ncbi:hypothetical protein VPH35_132009 [Triticum aestivum]
MVKRILNVPSGDRPVKLLKKSDEHDLRSIYKEGNRAPIAHVVKLLTSCSEEDVVMINRTWALLALATVLCPGTGNMVNLEYLASLEDMSLVHEFAWDEHLLARAMEEVGVFQEKKRMQANTEKEFQIASCLPMLAIIYMDHWLDKVDKNKLTLIQPFYGKHTHIRSLCNTPYAAQLAGQEVGAEAASGQGVGAEAPSGQGTSGQGSQVQGAENQAKNSQSNEAQQNVDAEPHLSSSLNDWLQQSFPSMQDLRVPTQFQMLYDKHKGIFAAEVDDVVGKFGQCLKGLQCSRMAALLRDVGDAITATSEPNFSFEAPIMDECRGKENDAKAANDGIGAQAQAKGTTPSINKDEVTGLKQQVATEAAETLSPIFENIPVFPVSNDDDSPTPKMDATEEQIVDASSGPSTHDKNTRKKRMAKIPAVKNTKAKKQKVDAAAATYEKYVKHGKPLRRSQANEQVTPFIKIGGFYIGYKKFLVCFKPRGDMNDEVMSLCIEMNNMASRAASGTNRKKYMFSVHAGILLKQDPTTFQPAKLIPELERAVTKFKANKYDLWNVFDSIHSKGKQSPLKKQANNLITNFAALAQEYSEFNVNVGSFARVDLKDYPKQDNLCDCGFFGLKYVENFNGKSMKEFKQEDMARYRMDVAHNLCIHPINNAPMERAFREELAA